MPMRHDYQPLLTPTEIDDLRPTQMTVGMIEVERKRRAWRERCEQQGSEFLGRHMIPVVLGPRKRLWLLDHHHLILALHLEGERHVLTSVVSDLSRLGREEFYRFMDNRGWLHPFDASGERHGHHKIPKRIRKLADDPYRSLASAVRRSGGYAKNNVPFSEFLWADFFRRRISDRHLRHDFDKAIDEAMALANSREAKHLPGWAGIEE